MQKHGRDLYFHVGCRKFQNKQAAQLTNQPSLTNARTIAPVVKKWEQFLRLCVNNVMSRKVTLNDWTMIKHGDACLYLHGWRSFVSPGRNRLIVSSQSNLSPVMIWRVRRQLAKKIVRHNLPRDSSLYISIPCVLGVNVWQYSAQGLLTTPLC